MDTFDLISRRLRERSRPGERRRADRAQLALAVEGGGMRGVVSAGMLLALEQLGALPAFDSVWGASAGSINATYFLTGQSDQGAPIYYEQLTGSDFINPRRFARGGDYLSLDYLFAVMRDVVPLDVSRLLASPISLHPIAFDLDAWSVVDLGHPSSEDDLYDKLRASSQVPLWAGHPIELGGRRYLDAACGEFIPVKTAFDGGASQVLALHTRPRGLSPQRPGRVEAAFYRRYLDGVDPRLTAQQLEREQAYRRQMDEIAAYGRRVLSIYPSGDAEPLAATARDRAAVLHGLQLGIRALLAAWPAPVARRDSRRQLVELGAQLASQAVRLKAEGQALHGRAIRRWRPLPLEPDANKASI